MDSAEPHGSPDQAAENLLLVIRTLMDEVHPQRSFAPAIELDSHFERDLGLDSLTRVELISRVERQFGIVLPRPNPPATCCAPSSGPGPRRLS